MKCQRQGEKKIDFSQSFQLDKDKKTLAHLRIWKSGEEETQIGIRQDIDDSSKVYQKDVFGQLMLRYCKRIFEVAKNEEHLILYWLSMLEYQVQLPLRFYMEENKSLNLRNGKYLWVETQFVLPSGTANEQSLVGQQELQKKVGKFFNEGLIPLIEKFKTERLNWEQMMIQEYNEEKVEEQLENEIVKRINSSFRVYCQ